MTDSSQADAGQPICALRPPRIDSEFRVFIRTAARFLDGIFFRISGHLGFDGCRQIDAADIGKFQGGFMRFGAKHNDIYPILGDMLRWSLGLANRHKRVQAEL